jgi:hypothetical protein
MLRQMLEATQPGGFAAVQAEVQCQATRITGDHIRIGRGPDAGTLRYRASAPLDKPLPDAVDRVLVVVHGALRDADNYFEHAVAAAGEWAATTLIVVPQFLADVDLAGRQELGGDTLHWGVEGWKSGEPSLGAAGLSSFTAMDHLLGRLTAPGFRPAGRKLTVVIMGNSAGGQFVNRYAAVGRGPDLLEEQGIPVRFVVSNPSTYLYFTEYRPVRVPDDTGVNRWRYGFEDPPPYVSGGADEYLRRYLARDVTIVLGREDRDNGALLLEVGSAAMAQGANRYDRGVKYYAHIMELAREDAVRHRLIPLAGVGHAAGDVMAADETRQIMFG